MKWFMNRKISQKLLVMTVISTILIGLVGFIGFYDTKVGNDQFEELMKKHFVMLDLSQDLRQQNRARQAALLRLISAEQNEHRTFIEQLRKRDKDVENQIARLEKMDLAADERQLFETVKQSAGQFLVMQDRVINLVTAGKPHEALLQYKQQEAVSEEFADRIRAFVKYQEDEAETVYQENQQLYHRTVIQLLAIIALSITVSFGLGYSISRTISKPLAEVVQEAATIANGDLSRKSLVLDRNDEVGVLVKEFNNMKLNLRSVIRDVAQAAEQLAASSEELTAGAEQSAEAANQIASTITEVAVGAEKQSNAITRTSAIVRQMSDGILKTAATSSTVAEMSGQTAVAAKDGLGAVGSAITQMGHVEATVNNSAAVVAKLGERSKEIGQIVEAISGLAGQTNLLALNAAIEAARAGEQGRGFAVVAEEVRKLAEQSQEAAKQIALLIGDIQLDTDKAVEAMNEGTTVVSKGAEAVNIAGHSFKQIANLVENVSGQVKEISTAMQQMAAGSQQIVNAVKEIDDIGKAATGHTQTVSAATEEQSASMEEIAAGSQSLAKMAEELQKSVHRFRV